MAIDLNRAWSTYTSLMTVSAPPPQAASATAPVHAAPPRPAAVKRIAAYQAVLSSNETLETLQQLYQLDQGRAAAVVPSAAPSIPAVLADDDFDYAAEQAPKPDAAEVRRLSAQYLVCIGQNPKDEAAIEKTAGFYGISMDRFERLKALVSQLQAG